MGQLLPPSKAGPSTGPQTSSQACGGQGVARRVSAFSQGQASRVLLDTEGGGGGLTEGSTGWAAQPLSNQRGKRPRLEPASGSERGADCTRMHACTLRPPREWPVGPLPTPPASATSSLTRGPQPLSEPGSACPRGHPCHPRSERGLWSWEQRGPGPRGWNPVPRASPAGPLSPGHVCTRGTSESRWQHSQGICSHSGTSRFQWLLDTELQ